jgi:hypothetical protein
LVLGFGLEAAFGFALVLAGLPVFFAAAFFAGIFTSQFIIGNTYYL